MSEVNELEEEEPAEGSRRRWSSFRNYARGYVGTALGREPAALSKAAGWSCKGTEGRERAKEWNGCPKGANPPRGGRGAEEGAS